MGTTSGPTSAVPDWFRGSTPVGQGLGLRLCAKSSVLPQQDRIARVESARFRLVANEEDIAALGAKAIGDYGEGVAENYLREMGVTTLRQVRFEGPKGYFHADLFDPLTRTIYEVKTGSFELGLLDYQIRDYRHALRTNQAKRVVYINVSILGRKGFTAELIEHLSGFGLIELD